MNERILGALLDTVPDLVVLVDSAGRITLFNHACEELTGYGRDEALGQPLSEFLVPREWMDVVQQRFADPFSPQVREPHENPWVTKSGEERLIRWRCTALRLVEGDPPYILGIGTDVTQQRRAELGLHDALNQLRVLSQQLVDVQEHERRRIARELHDEVGQRLTALRMALEKNSIEQNRDAGDARVCEALAITNDLFQCVRQISFDLRPPMLDDLGLLAALLWLMDRHHEQTGLEIAFKHSGLENRLPQEVETAVYRITQEALTNVTRHAGVRQAKVSVWVTEQSVVLRIEDQGSGFDPGAVRKTGKGSGLLGMQERAKLLGGSVTLDTGAGAGTIVTAELPRHFPHAP